MSEGKEHALTAQGRGLKHKPQETRILLVETYDLIKRPSGRDGRERVRRRTIEDKNRQWGARYLIMDQ